MIQLFVNKSVCAFLFSFLGKSLRSGIIEHKHFKDFDTNDHSSLNLEKLIWGYGFRTSWSPAYQWEFVLAYLLLKKSWFSELVGDSNTEEKRRNKLWRLNYGNFLFSDFELLLHFFGYLKMWIIPNFYCKLS